ncbi:MULTISPECIES: response regulator [unclassified Oceanispirochaeta]|uniref:response regulator transcription factor n=1 Tax=unclassified Oceanispirochaeta TaxID=2635722 RepID=UPI000E094A23|nr:MULTISPECIES: response regulator [unclassified Oceanispirochaeta]MBF9017585.1 response regulator [Oceanispirochaeta sp. M2]NPD74157.1 response regulator [Oceanispirochaeta sp. M1]RDG29971.1 response regulator [Oceanispirochaeta sp. M1]
MSNHEYFTVVVAEDEQIILEDVIDKIRKTESCFKIVASTMNGEDAFEAVSRHQPDILFTDIKMPIFDGLELIRKVKEHNPDIYIVILSGYNDFSYAQQAILYNVKSYLLKPLRIEDLKETISDIKDKLREKRNIIDKKYIAESIRGIKRDHFGISSLPDQSFSIFHICLGNLYNNVPELLDTNLYDAYWAEIDWAEIIDNFFNINLKWWILDDKLLNRKILVISLDDPSTYTVASFMNALLKDISQNLNRSVQVTICSDEKVVNFSELKESSGRINKLLIGNLMLFHSAVIGLREKDSVNAQISFDSSIKNIIEKALCLNNIQILNLEIRKIFDLWSIGKCTQKHIQKELLKIIKQVIDISGCRDIETIEASESSTYRFIALSESMELLCVQFLEMIQVYLKPSLKYSHVSNSLFPKIEKYLQDNFTEPINVSFLSDKFNYDSSHIIRSFKKNSGLTPIQYLINLRIEKSKELMTENRLLSFKVISQIVGYEDQNYFSRIFKKVTGMNPSEYRESLD